MARQRTGTDYQLIERIFDQLSSSVAIALLKDNKLSYEFYGGRKTASADNAAQNIFAANSGHIAAGVHTASGFWNNGKKASSKNSESGVNRSTRFNFGSASDIFTGSLVIKLMEFDEIRLNDTVRRFIPEFEFEDVAIFHLLTYAPGLFPDAVSHGYSILGEIVEKVSGQTLEELASVLLFMPLGMKHTTYDATVLRDNQYISLEQNGIYTTALDLVRFGRMFLNGGEYEGRPVFLESSVEFMLREITGGKQMRTPLFMIKRNVDVHGCFSEKQSPETVAAIGDTGSMFFIDPRRGVVGATLTNSSWVHSLSRNYGNIADILMSI